VRAAFYRRTGPAAEVLELGERPNPEPGPGEVLVRVRASGVNPADVKRRAGWLGARMKHPLVIPHCDGAGEVEAVGRGVSEARLGQRIWLWNAQGGYGEAGRAFGTAAERIALPSEQAVPLPDGMSFEEGACLGVPAMTAHRAVFADGPVEGLTVLVAGAGGAVGHLAVQFAVAGGARVVGTAGTPERAAHAREAGAEAVIDRHGDVAAEVMAATGGVDRVVEVDLAANFATDVAVLRPNGVIASYSSSSDPRPVLPYYDLAAKGLTIRVLQGFALPTEARRAGREAIDALAGEGRLRVAVGLRLPLGRVAEAHERVEAGDVVGNVVIAVP
jgi:NADPH:quinone reductase-like Zn-dependent oxidoreductase